MRSFLNKIDFGNEAGDDVDYHDLSRYFFEQQNFQKFTDPSKKLLVATAKKGVGKSALLRWTKGRIEQVCPDDIVIECRGSDLVRSRFGIEGRTSLPNERIRDWQVRICALANRELAKRVGWAMTDDKITLVESAELDGFRQRNFIGCLIDRLGKMLPNNGPEKAKPKQELELLKRVKDRRLWVLIDDIDATFQNTKEELLETATCFSALRYLTHEVSGLNFRVTLRTDVWPMIRRYDESLDKLEQYVSEIMWSRDEFRGILYKRIKAQMIALDQKFPEVKPTDSEPSTEQKFIDTVLADKMDWAEKSIPNYHVLYTLSYQRPRWGIQLCKLAQRNALDRRGDRILKADIDEVWGEYGTRRIADLVSEHKHQCVEVEELVLAFRGADRLMERDALFNWINRRILPHVNTSIEGRTVTSPKEIARFLYRIGFIVARSDDNGSYEHYSFDQMPDFLSSRTDEDFGVAWEIHPCYRQALDIQKVDRSHRARFGKMRGEGRHR